MQSGVDIGRFVLFKKLARKCQAFFKRSPCSRVIAGLQPGVSQLFESEHDIQPALSGRAPPPFVVTLFGVSTWAGDQARRCIWGVGSVTVVLCNKAAPST